MRFLAACFWSCSSEKRAAILENATADDKEKFQKNFETNNDHPIFQIGKDLSESTREALNMELKTVLSSQKVGQDQNKNQSWIVALNNLKTNMRRMSQIESGNGNELFENKSPNFENDTKLIDDMICFAEEIILNNNVAPKIPETEILTLEDEKDLEKFHQEEGILDEDAKSIKQDSLQNQSVKNFDLDFRL